MQNAEEKRERGCPHKKARGEEVGAANMRESEGRALTM